ncbi:MAG: 4Fe-4S binding protein [Pseudoflavonifractor sp.]|nr:4Fe-4S binding protein [Pseudoflavonifractor sp.]
MGKEQDWMKAHPRAFVQLCVTALSNGYAVGFARGTIFKGRTKGFCLPGLNCYSCPGALGACPIGSLQAVLTSPEYSFSFYVVGFMLVIGAICGRFVCGWLCPFGFFQDLLHKIPFPKKLRRLPGEKFLRLLRYAVLVGLVILLPMFVADAYGLGEPWFCAYLCPAGTLEAGIPLTLASSALREATGWVFRWKILILVLLIFLSLVVYRPFCRYLCPLGAVYGMCNPVSLVRLKIDQSACVQCGACQKACPLDIPVWQKPNGADCIRCGKCVRACPCGAIQAPFVKGGQTISTKG